MDRLNCGPYTAYRFLMVVKSIIAFLVILTELLNNRVTEISNWEWVLISYVFRSASFVLMHFDSLPTWTHNAYMSHFVYLILSGFIFYAFRSKRMILLYESIYNVYRDSKSSSYFTFEFITDCWHVQINSLTFYKCIFVIPNERTFSLNERTFLTLILIFNSILYNIFAIFLLHPLWRRTEFVFSLFFFLSCRLKSFHNIFQLWWWWLTSSIYHFLLPHRPPIA